MQVQLFSYRFITEQLESPAMKCRILLTDPVHPDAEAAMALLGDVIRLADDSQQTLHDAMVKATYCVVRRTLPVSCMAYATGVRAFIRHGAGVDLIPVVEATAHGIPVLNVPGENTRSVVELVMAQLLAMCRGTPELDQLVRRGAWETPQRYAGRELGGSTVGIVGLGRVGRALASVLTDGFGCRVVGCRRGQESVSGVELCSLASLFAQADHVVICVPLDDSTRSLIGHAEFSQMRPGATLVNVARAGVIQPAALRWALDEGGLAAAALDVFHAEPPPADEPLINHPRVLLTPHVGGLTQQAHRRVGLQVAALISDLERGHRPTNVVNPEVWR